ncbi:MAG: DUF3944 domain-containing protein [Fusobacterium sp.]|uniref:DUF3944 domain-containing protein n=1 Tax=Fusobacterium sp. TaxID=68766 RepID=UPI003FA0A4CD
MSYREDKDLDFLAKCDNEDLGELFKLLVYDPKDDEKRFTQTLLISDEFKRYGDNYQKYWQRIAEELQLFGGNTISNLFRRGSGVLYREILEDVAKEQKISFEKYNSTIDIENKLILKVSEEIFNSLSEEEQKKLIDELTENNNELKKILASYKSDIPYAKIGTSIIREVLKRGGFATYKLTLIVVNMLWKSLFGKGLSLVANSTITKVLASFLAAPIAIVINAWILVDIASPAMRVTFPAVFLIATLRKKIESNSN